MEGQRNKRESIIPESKIAKDGKDCKRRRERVLKERCGEEIERKAQPSKQGYFKKLGYKEDSSRVGGNERHDGLHEVNNVI